MAYSRTAGTPPTVPDLPPLEPPVFPPPPVGSLTALHVDGTLVKDVGDNIVYLDGVNISRFIDDGRGDWQTAGGIIEWATFSETTVKENLDAIAAWGGHAVRVLSTCEWWINDSNNHQQNIKNFIQWAADRNLYVIYTFWRVSAADGGTAPALPWPPDAAANAFILDQTDFEDMWTDIATDLQGYDNVIFELFNEPWGTIADWFDAAQNCITNIRGTGASNLIVIQYGSCVGYDYAGYPGESPYDLDWIDDYPLVDTENNLVYSTHLYRYSFYNSDDGYIAIYDDLWDYKTGDDLAWGMDVNDYLDQFALVPLWIGEVGYAHWAVDQPNEVIWYNNILDYLQAHRGVGFCGWDWWPHGGDNWGLLEGAMANFQPSPGGAILKANF